MNESKQRRSKPTDPSSRSKRETSKRTSPAAPPQTRRSGPPGTGEPTRVSRSTAQSDPAVREKKPSSPPAAPERRAEEQDRPRSGVTASEREKLIAERAYLRAEQRGFVGGSQEQDWLEAEREVDEELLRSGGRHARGPGRDKGSR